MIVLQIHFHVVRENCSAFEAYFGDVYLPALQQQVGFMGGRLLRLYPQEVNAEIGASFTPFNYQMELEFDGEARRRRWVASVEHEAVWKAATALAVAAEHRGYDVVT